MLRSQVEQVVLLLVLIFCGCESRPAPPQGSAPLSPGEKGAIRRDVEQAAEEAKSIVAPDPVVAIPAVPGWHNGIPRALPADSDGFTIAYDHPSGITVTLYQYTRGMQTVPADPAADEVQVELERAKSGIQTAVELGQWSSAKEIESGKVALGNSEQRALWSRFALVADGNDATSDTYVWTCNNAFFKVRCTRLTESLSKSQDAVDLLLTEFGKACQESASQQ